MKVVAWFEDVIGGERARVRQGARSHTHGPASTFVCSRNPNTRQFWLGTGRRLLRSYNVDGLMWGSERQGPLGNVIVANQAATAPAAVSPVSVDTASRPERRRHRHRAREGGYTQLSPGRPRSAAAPPAGRRVRHVLAPAREVSRDHGVGTSVERGAQRYVP